MTNAHKPPLWEVMYQARNTCGAPVDRASYAAEIRAIADWLIPDDPVPQIVLESSLEAFGIYMMLHRQRMFIRESLLREADELEATSQFGES